MLVIEERVRATIDTFNRFRRPAVEAKLVQADGGRVIIEFVGSLDEIDAYVRYFMEDLEEAAGTVKIESVRRNGTCRATFLIKNVEDEEDDPLQKALKIISGYNQGISSIKYEFED